MLGTFVLAIRDNNNSAPRHSELDNHHQDDGTENASGWDHFVRRMNSSCEDRRSCDLNSSPKDNIWLVVAISVLYFFLVALVLLVLLLAPKWTPLQTIASDPHTSTSLTSSTTSIESESVNQEAPVNDDEAADDYAMMDSKEAFQGSPKDPLYDIDPRSSIFRGDGHKWLVPTGRRDEMGKRVNNKFLRN